LAYLEIKKSSILHNIQVLYDFCIKHRIQLCAVTKCCCSDGEIITLLYNSGIKEIADSNMENFAKIPAGIAGSLRKSVIKTRLSDILSIHSLPLNIRPQRVFVSDEILLDALAEIPPDSCPEIMLIVEIGDLKEGFYPDKIPSICEKYSNLPIIGLSANYACLSGKMPCLESACLLSELTGKIKTKNNTLPLVSLGGTAAYRLFYDDGFQEKKSEKCNWELRCGEGIFLGFDSSAGNDLPGFKKDAFKLFGEIIEVCEKEYIEHDKKGRNATGEYNSIPINGKRLNMILDFGILAGPIKNIHPLDNSIKITGQTFDFTVVDIIESDVKYKTGQYAGFALSYGAVSHSMLNKYIKKEYR